MIHYPIEQGSLEWLHARRGIPTASRFHNILTPAKGEFSKSAGPYMYALIAEWASGEVGDNGDTPFTWRGRELEERARGWYELETGREIEPAGFFTTDDGGAGASPDGLVGDDGLVEIKCLAAGNHLAACDSDGAEGDRYLWQVQGQLWICEREWCDRVWYNGTFGAHIVRVHRDPEAIDKLADAVRMFNFNMDAIRLRLVKRGIIRQFVPPPPMDAEFTDAEIAAMGERA